MEDRRSRMQTSTVNAPAKKGGAGGSYTWGSPLDVPTDYSPVGVQGGQKVTTDVIEDLPVARQPSARTLGVRPESEQQFPPLAPNPAAQGGWGMQQRKKDAPLPQAAAATSSIPEDGLVSSLRRRVRAAAGQVRARAAGRVAAARGAAAEAKATTTRYAMDLFGLATSNYQELRARGIKAWVSTTAQAAQKYGRHLLSESRAKALAVGGKAREVAADRSFQATAASATGGAVTLGATGGAAGLAAGSVVGAAVGLVPALFTFGLSIPIGAAIGGTCGLVTGAAAGSTVGAVGGGAAGYGAYAKREEICNAASQVQARVQDSTTFVKGKVAASAGFARERVEASAGQLRDGAAAVRSRLVGPRS